MSSKAKSNPESRLDNPSERMRNLWFFNIMLPAAVVAWTASRKISVTVGAAISMPFLAFVQGFFGMLTYRCCFGDAPKPFSPCHGVVAVDSDDDDEAESEESSSLVPAPIPAVLHTNAPDARVDQVLQNAIEQPPIRLLVMGDSLTVGVGQSKTCTPILPETIAKTISKRLGGRAVYWTCHGFPGASTGWIVKQLECDTSKRYCERFPGRLEVQSSFSDSEDLSSASEESHEGSSERASSLRRRSKLGTVRTWSDRLATQRQRFESDLKGPYDVTVCVIGANDLKSTFFPFLLKGEAAENWKRSQERGGYTQELGRLLSHVRKIVRSSEGDESSSTTTKPTHSPLVVLPGMPARALPAFQHFPLQHISVPMVDIMDSHKRDLATNHSGEVLFVDPPPLVRFDEYAEKTGAMWKERCREKVALTLHDNGVDESAKLVDTMQEYYRHRDPHLQGACAGRSTNLVNRMMGPPPSHWKAFSIDKTHPNEYGYDCWGRHIGNAVCDEWQRLHG